MSQLNKLNLNLDKHVFPGGNMCTNISFVCVCVCVCVCAMSRLGVQSNLQCYFSLLESYSLKGLQLTVIIIILSLL